MTHDDALVEKVARAVTPILFCGREDWKGRAVPDPTFEDLEPDWQDRAREVARAALSAMPDELARLRGEVEELRSAIKRQASAVRALHMNEATEINQLRAKATEAHRAVTSLDSERDMNALLTDENENLRRALERQHRNFHLLLQGKPVRDVEETDTELRAALAPPA